MTLMPLVYHKIKKLSTTPKQIPSIHNLHLYSMIFKTFDNDIDKWTAKIGIFGKSFNELGAAVNNAFKSAMNNIDNLDENVGFGEIIRNNLFPTKEKIQALKHSVPELLDTTKANEYVKIIKAIDNGSMDGIETFQQWYDTLSEGEKWIAQYAQETQGQIRSVEGVTEANKAARDTAIAHNNALKQQTLGAKAATIGLNALATAGNMLIMWGISEAISFVVNAIDKYANAAEYAKEASDNAKQSMDELKNNLDEQSKTVEGSGRRYAELAQHVNQLNNANIDLSDEEYKEFLSLSNELAEVFPTLKIRMDENGNAVLGLKGNIAAINDTLDNYIEKAKTATQIESIKKFTGEDDNDEYFKGAKIKANEAQEEIEKYQGNLDAINDVEALLNDMPLSKNDNPEVQRRRTLIESDISYLDSHGQLSLDDKQTIEAALNNIVNAESFEDRKDHSEKLSQILNQSKIDNSGHLDNAKIDLDTQNQEISSYGQAILERSAAYLNEDDQDVRNAMLNAFNMIDWSQTDLKTGEEAADWIKNTFASSIGKMNDDDQKTFLDFFNPSEDMDLSQYLALYKKINSIFEAQDIEVPLDFNINDANDIQNKLDGQRENFEKSTTKSRASSSLSFPDAWDELDNTENDNYKNLKKDLMELAETGKLTTETLQNTDGASDWLKEYSIDAQTATKKINEMVDSAEQLSAMHTGITAITSAYDEKKESRQHTVSASTLDSMYNALGVEGWGDSDKKVWEEYKSSATDGQKDMASLKKAQDALATSFVNSNNFLADLNNSNKDYYETLLKEMGVANAHQLVTDRLKLSEKNLKIVKDELGVTTEDLDNVTLSEVSSLYDEKTASEEAKRALYNLVLEKIQAGQMTITTAADCQNLINMANSAGIASSKIRELLNAQIQLSSAENASKLLNQYKAAAKQYHNKTGYTDSNSPLPDQVTPCRQG